MGKIWFETSAPAKEFTEHLSIPNNNRIIFSGPFGSGKTSFIGEFFKDGKYAPIHLFPVNYSVATNEDIFKFLKFDILLELLRYNEIFEKEDFSHILTLQLFVLNNPDKIAESILGKVPIIGKSIYKAAKSLSGFVEKYEKFKQQTSINEENETLNFLKKHVSENKTLYEDDAITELIQVLVSRLKTKKKETVLITDDLDRIDPEHIFRLLNVFAAHIDLKTEENKFGFDRVVFVCDIENIRNIFAAKYGSKVDFSGYIDKFFSAEIHEFDNKREIMNEVRNFTKSIEFTVSVGNKYVYSDSLSSDVRFLVEALVVSDSINLRALKKFENENWKINTYETRFEYQNIWITSDNLPFLTMLDYLSYILGSGNQLLNAFEKVTTYNHINGLIDRSDKDHKYKLRHMIPLLEWRNSYRSGEKYTCSFPVDSSYNINFTYSIASDSRLPVAQIESIKRYSISMGIGSDINEIDSKTFFAILVSLIRHLQSYGLLK